MDSICSPSVTFDGKTCFSSQQLEEIRKAINKSGYSTISPSYNKHNLYSSIRETVSSCRDKDESCLIEQKQILKNIPKNIREKLLYFTFKPQKPKEKFQWLSNYDIVYVMKQYEQKYRFFYFFGAVPLDFETINYPEFWSVRIEDFGQKIKENYKCLGMIINLSKSKNKDGGSHWVALFVDLRYKKKTIEYFDSSGHKPPIEIIEFMNRLNKHIPNSLIKINKVRHQQKDSECGVYSIMFIISRLRGSSFEEISSNVARDEHMNSMRDVIFRSS